MSAKESKNTLTNDEQLSISLSRVKLIICSMDGVITDGKVMYDELGNTLFKNYCFSDFEAINKLKKVYNFCFISSDNAINYNLCRRKNIPFFWAKKSKLDTVKSILNRYGVSPLEVIFIGATISDAEVATMIPLSFTPETSSAQFNRFYLSLSARPGEGVMCALLSFLNRFAFFRRALCC